MDWNDLPFVCFTLSTLLCLVGRRWIDAGSSACFAAFTMFDRILPQMVPSPLKWAFAVVGAVLVVSQVAKEYRNYKKSLAAR